jgi:hypothetical protein
LFIFLLFATAFDVGFIRTATHPGTVKKLVAESGLYNSLTPALLQQEKSITTAYGVVPASDPAVQKAANVALSPQFIQQNAEMVVDNIYAWLDGKIAQPNFNVDLSGTKVLFANNIADSLQKRMVALPACSAAQSRAIALNGNFDAYNVTCLPRGVNPATVAEQAKSSIVSGDNFLNNLKLNANNIGGDNKSPFGQKGVKNIPLQYQRAKKTPLILSILTILTGAGIVLLSSTWQKGLRHIGLNLLIIGIIMLVFSWVLNRTVSTNIAPKIKIDNVVLQQDVRDLVIDLSQQVDKNYWYFGTVYAVVGAAAFGLGHFYHRRSQVLPVGNAPAAKLTPVKTKPKK